MDSSALNSSLQRNEKKIPDLESIPNTMDATADNSSLQRNEKKILDLDSIAVGEAANTQNHATPTTADDLNPIKKRPRDPPQMAEHQHHPNASPEIAEPTKGEKAAKVAKLRSAEEGEDATKEGNAGGGSHHQRHKRRKIALIVAYCGVGYQGMQRNPGAKTIEGELEEALFKAGAISEDMHGNPRMIDWMRSARTDKGVSAVGQVVSGRFFIDPPGFVERVNSHLPEQIRVLGFKRVTPSFSAKKFCDRRRYEYVLPVFALDPSAHRDRESVLASEGKEGALIKCLECSERGRKVLGVMGRKNEHGPRGVNGMDVGGVNNGDLNEKTLENYDGMSVETVNDNEINEKTLRNRNEIVVETVSDNEINEKTVENHDGTAVEAVKNNEINEKTSTNHDVMDMVAANDNGFNTKALENHEKTENPSEMRCEESGRQEIGLIPETVDVDHVAKNPNEGIDSLERAVSDQAAFRKGFELEKVPVGQTDEAAVRSTFQYGEKERERFNSILKQFVGTHNFHNLTTRTKAEDPAAYRYILSFETSDVFTIDGMDFVRCTVVGQSFMLHQIRKMMGLAVAVMRGCASESIIATALKKDVHMNVPTAPELGLFLDESYFPAYNQKWQSTHEEVSLKGFEQQILEFKQKYIYKHIASTEVKEGVVALWLHSLNQRNYPDFVAARESDKDQNRSESIVPGPNKSIADTELPAN